MLVAEAMRLAAERGCELTRDTGNGDWVIRSIAYDSDPCALSDEQLLRIGADSFLRDYIPDRL